MSKLKFFRCENKACPQGTVGDTSFFSGGMTAAQKTILTGEPESELKDGTDYGEGVCPTCGVKGKPDPVDRTPHKGHDPYQDLHDKGYSQELINEIVEKKERGES